MLTPLLASALLLGSAPTPVKIAPVQLERLALITDAAVIGRVVAVHDLETARTEDGETFYPTTRPIAEIEVESVLSGAPGTERLWYYAAGAWTCDVTGAVEGERALFFLGQSSPASDTCPTLQSDARSLTGGQPVLECAWGGRGRMPIRVDEHGTSWVTSWTDVLTPDGLETRPADHHGRYRNVYWTAELDDVVRIVEECLAAHSLRVPAHPVSGLPAWLSLVGPWDDVIFAAWRDGTAVWSADRVHGGPPYSTGRVTDFDSGWWRDLELGPETWELESPPRFPTQRITSRSFLFLHDVWVEAHDEWADSTILRDGLLELIPESGEPLGRDVVIVR